MRIPTVLASIVVPLFIPLLVQAQNASLVSPEFGEQGKVTFRCRALEAQEVVLRGQWNRQPLTMTRQENGVWEVTAESVPAGVWEYNFVVDERGER